LHDFFNWNSILISLRNNCWSNIHLLCLFDIKWKYIHCTALFWLKL
jgi:hypothetical protein